MKQCLQFITILSFFMMSQSLIGQVTTATLIGDVNDMNGEELIGAAITALHEPSGVTYGTTSRIDGSFTLPNLKVGGPYTIEATYVGYKTSKIENVNLILAQKLRLNFELEEAPMAVV